MSKRRVDNTQWTRQDQERPSTSKCSRSAKKASLLVGAIDFGTTFSGWAYSFLHEFQSDATKATVKHWHSGSGSLVTEKTPTCALISPDGKKLVAFGYDAENKYRELAENDEHREYYYFRRFKMALNKENISRDIMIDDEMGKRFPAIDVFCFSIASLVEDMITVGNNTVIGGITKADVHWVLTVPAIWSDAAKQFMREAAEKKPASIEPEKLSIALEPEAASIFCRHLSVENVKGTDTVSKLQDGTKYMILDAGGGTIDITVHMVTSSGGLKEVHAATGGGWGGIMVDEAFKNLLRDLLGGRVYEKFVKKETEDWLELWRTFEAKKKMIEPNKDEKVNMKLPLSLIDLCKEETGRDLKGMIADSKYSSEIELSRDKVRYANSRMQKLFSDSIQKTISHVKTVLRDGKAQGVNAILMVGGYSESPMLQEAIKREFSNMKIIIPSEASSAILRGAVIFGHSPRSITQRILKKTYGFQVRTTFKKDIHPEKYKKIKDGVEKCSCVFSKHVERDQAITVGEAQVSQNYHPSESNQTSIGFRLFASDLKNPKYTAEGCTEVGEMTVDISDVPGDLDRKIDVSLTFSDTEIRATAQVEKTGQVVTASFDFLG